MLELIDSLDALAAIAPEWRDLCARAPQATIFQTPEWLLPWWEHLGGGSLRALAMRSGGRLCGFAPLFQHGMPGENIRQLSFVGAGVTDYLDFIAEPHAAEDFVPGVRGWLDERRCEWDVLNLEELRAGAIALQYDASEPCSVCPVIELPESVETWEASFNKVHRRNVRHARAHGNFRYEVCKDAAAFDEFVRLHELSWRERNQPGVLNTPRLRAFYGAAAETLATAGSLRMHLLWRDESLAGIIFGMEYKARGYAYLGGFDPALRDSSPGTVLMWHAVAGGIDAGLREWDLLRGSEAYKYLWGAKDRGNRKIRIVNR